MNRFPSPWSSSFVLVCICIPLTWIFDWDIKLAKWLYTVQGGAWKLRFHWLTFTVVHEWGKRLAILGGICMITTCIGCYIRANDRQRFRALCLSLYSSLFCIIFIGLLKKITHMDGPVDLLQFGGTKPYLSLLTSHPGTFPYGRSWPAGHAAGAYCWYSLVWMQRVLKAGRPGLTAVLVSLAGIIFGFSQQLRGEHFLSDDMVTIVICWLTPWFVFKKWGRG